MPALTMKKLFSFVGKKKNQGSKLDYSNQYDNLLHPPYSPNVYLNHNPPPPPHTLAQRQQLYAQHQIIPSPLPLPVSQPMALQPQQIQHHNQQATQAPQCLCQNYLYQPGANYNQTSQVQVLPHQAQLNVPSQQQQNCSQLIQQNTQYQQIQHQQVQQQQQHHHQQHHHHHHHHQLQLQQQQQLHHQLQQQFQSSQPQQQNLNLQSNLNQNYGSQAPNVPAIAPPVSTQCVCLNCTNAPQAHQPSQQQLYQINHPQQHQHHPLNNNFQQQQHHHQQQQQQHATVNEQQIVSQFNGLYQNQTSQPAIQQIAQQQQQSLQQQTQYHNHGLQLHQSQINENNQTQQPLTTTVTSVPEANQPQQYQHQTVANQIQPQQYHCHTIQSHQYEQQKQQFQQEQHQHQQHQHQRVQSLCLQSIQPSHTYQDFAQQQAIQPSRTEQHLDLKGESLDSKYANSSVWQSIQSSQRINRYFEKSNNPKLEEHVYYNQQKHLLPYEPPPSYDTFMERKVKNSLYLNGHQYLTCRSESLENKDSSYENLRRSRNSIYSNLANGRQELGHTS